MTVTITHAKVSGKAAGSDPDRVYGTHWDAAHAISGTFVETATTPLSIDGSNNLTISAASETAAGVVELATDAETQTGTDTARAITPANLAARTATATRTGVVELATDAETITGTDTARAITPANLAARTSTDARTGIVELATDAETVTGTDTARAVTPANVTARLAAPGAIGGTTPAAGAFTTVSATGLITATGGQIAFPASQSASADANTLDDYEEGSFTPTLTFGGGNTGLTFSTQTGKYTKIGNVVHYSLHIVLSAKGSSTGDASIGGLPFTSSSLNCPAVVQANSFAASAATQVQAVVVGSTTTIIPARFAAGVLTTMADTDFTNSSILRASGIYFV